MAEFDESNAQSSKQLHLMLEFRVSSKGFGVAVLAFCAALCSNVPHKATQL